VRKTMMIAVCILFVFSVVGISFAQEKAAAKPAASAAQPKVVKEVAVQKIAGKDKSGKPVVKEVAVEEMVGKDKSGNPVVEEVAVEEVVGKDKSGKPVVEEVAVEEVVKRVPPVTTAATTALANIK
jgi:hypothetical protein